MTGQAQLLEPRERIFTIPFVSLMAADFCLKICLFMQSALLPLYVIERGFPSTIAGLTTTMYMLPALLFRPISGKMADAKDRYVVMIFGSVLYFLGTGLYLFAIPIAVLLVMRAIQGVGFSFNGTGIYALATDYIPENRMSEGIGYLGLAQTLAMAFSPTIALAVKDKFGYQAAFMLILTLSGITLLVVMLLKLFAKRPGGKAAESVEQASASAKPMQAEPAVPKAEKKPSDGGILSKIVDRNALNPSLLILILMFAATTLNTFLVTYATISGISNPGLFFTVQSAMVMFARLVAGRISRRYGEATVLIPGIILIGMSFAGLIFCGNVPLFLACGACYGLGFGAVQPQLNSLAVLAADKENRGMANSTFFMMMDLGAATSGFVLGAVADAAGFPSIYAIATVLAAVALVFYLIMRKRGAIA